jgi:hypothetical protein
VCCVRCRRLTNAATMLVPTTTKNTVTALVQCVAAPHRQ